MAAQGHGRSSERSVADVSSASYRVPTDAPEGDGTLTWSSTTMVTATVAAEGEQGLGWTYGSTASQRVVDEILRDVVVGRDLMDVVGANEAMFRACRNLGREGVVSSAIAAVDIALWDLKARLLGLPLAKLFGQWAASAPAYGSGGFTTYDDEQTAGQVDGWLEAGLRRVKIKIGESFGSEVERDLRRVAFVRKLIGDHTDLFVDANGGYTRKQAIRLADCLYHDHGVTWFEEPVSSDDLAGLREVRDQSEVDVAAGEYGYTDTYFAHMVEAQAVDCLQIDVTRCGGYTVWVRAAAIAAAHGLQVSAHCAPALHVPIVVSVPNFRHVEYFHDHVRIEHMLVDGAPSLSEGALVPDLDRPGHGLALRAADADRVRVS